MFSGFYFSLVTLLDLLLLLVILLILHHCVDFYFSKPTLLRVLKCFSLPSSPLTRGKRKRKLIGKEVCRLLTSGSLGQFYCSLSGYQQSSPVANIKCESVVVAQLSQQKWPESAGIPREALWRVSLYWVGTSETLHGVPVQEHPFTVCWILFIPFSNSRSPLSCL